jgi:hypothetical protein
MSEDIKDSTNSEELSVEQTEETPISEEANEETLDTETVWEEDTDQEKTIEDDEFDIYDILSHKKDTAEFDPERLVQSGISATASEVVEKIEELLSTLSPSEIRAQLEDTTSQLYILRNILDDLSVAVDFNKSQLDTTKGKELKSKYVKDDIKLVDASPVDRTDRNGKIVTGKEAELLILTKEADARRIQLLNSGFHITLRGPKLSELSAFYDKTYTETVVYGKEFGTHFYLFNSLIIKEAVIDLFKKLVTDAELKNWNRGDTLLKSISLLDYDSIVWAIGSLMFKKGYPMTFTCTNAGCNYTEKKTIDLRKIRFNNYSMLSEDCINILGNRSRKTQKDIVDYQDTLNLSKSIEMHNNWVAITKVPSLYDFMDYGAQFNASLIKSVHSLEHTEDILRYLKYNAYKIFAPWIKEIRSMNEDGSINFRVTDIALISKILDSELLEDTEFGMQMRDFVTESAVSHIGIPYEKCPECGYVPKSAINGILPMDIQYTFFVQSVMMLSQ